MGLARAVKPITYLKNHAAEVVREVHKTGGEMIITQNGEAKAVVMDVATWDRWQDTLAMLKIIAQGEQDIAHGRTYSTEEAFAHALAAVKKVEREREED